MSERYELMMSRERWRGAGTGAALCQAALFALYVISRLAGAGEMSGWLWACGPLTQLLALWRQHVVMKRISAIDGGFREAVKPEPQPAPKEKVMN